MKNIRVMIIDDSAVVRQVLSDMINGTDGMEVIDVAIDPVFALKKLKEIRPDVITLDVEMPRMDGLTFLEQLMRENPIAVVMCSRLTQESAAVSLRALRLGAIEVVAKPVANLKQALPLQNKAIIDAIRVAAKVNPANLRPASHGDGKDIPARAWQVAEAESAIPTQGAVDTPSRMIAIGASTGGTQALEYLLSRVDSTTPGIVVVQHMPRAFTGPFAQRLDGLSPMSVKEAADGDGIEHGTVLVAPGEQHMLVENQAGKLRVRIKPGPLVSRHCPSIDVLFRSAALSASSQALGIIMTGMGEDGASGLKELYDAGAFTIAQDEASCVIFGMPARALQYGGVRVSCSLQQIVDMMNAYGQPQAFQKLTAFCG